jgi:hypothetical protein
LSLQSEKGKFIAEAPKERTLKQQFGLVEVGKLVLYFSFGP